MYIKYSVHGTVKGNNHLQKLFVKINFKAFECQFCQLCVHWQWLTELVNLSRHIYDEFGRHRVLSDTFPKPHRSRCKIKSFITFFVSFSHSTEVSMQNLTKKAQSCLYVVCISEVMNGVVESSDGTTPTYVHLEESDRSFFSNFL